MHKNVLLFFISFSLITFVAEGQDFNSVTPLTPEAAHLQKEVNIPVDKSSGVPNLAIPLYELKTGKVTIPISLSYHASGIQVGQLSSSVGLGWGLNAGGAINRSVRGKADEGNDGWMHDNYTAHFANTVNDGSWGANQYLFQGHDFTQDDYSYNFLNYSGSYFFDSLHAIRLVMRDPLKIQKNSNNTYTVKDFGGYSYFFDSADYAARTTFTYGSTSTNLPLPSVSSWRLTKVKYQTLDSVVFDYEKYNVSYQYNSADIYDGNYGFRTYIPGVIGQQTCGDGYPTNITYKVTMTDFESSLVKEILSRSTKMYPHGQLHLDRDDVGG